jgi:undecaprenyl-diphosphooligosaccharide--protein glycosyltransferase
MRWQRWLTPPDDAVSRRAFAVTLLAIIACGAAVRLFWLMRVGWDLAPLQVGGTTLLTSPDGYWFAAGAGHALDGSWAGHPRLPAAHDHLLVALTWLCTKVLPLPLEQVALYLPTILGPLIAVPIAHIGRELGSSAVGLAAALAAAVLPIYASRTAAGYLDTDAFALLVPLLAAFYLIRLLRRGHRRDGLYAALVLALYPFAYAPGLPVGFAVAALGSVALSLRYRRQLAAASQAAAPLSPSTLPTASAPAHPVPAVAPLVLIGLSQAPLAWPLRVALVLGTYAAAPYLMRALPRPRHPGRVLAAVAIAVGGAAFFALRLWEVLPDLLAATSATDDQILASTAKGQPIYGDTAQYVAEAQRVAVGTFASHVAGAWPIFALGLLGALAMLLRFRVTLLLLPFWGLGLLGLAAGLRFAIYATPIIALGLGFAVVLVTGRLLAARPKGRWPATTLALAAVLTPAVLQDWRSVPTTALIAPEVAAMQALGAAATSEDATVAWWDYGYPLIYFAKTRVLADGGRHDEDSALVAEILMSRSQAASARLTRLGTEIQQAHIATDWGIAPTLFLQAYERGLGPTQFLAQLAELAEPAGIPAATRGAYLYLPARLLTLLATINDLRPRAADQPLPVPGTYRFWRGTKVEGATLRIGPNASVDVAAVTINEGGTKRALKAIYSTSGAAADLDVRARARHPDATTSGIYLHDHSIFIELDDDYLHSTAVQLLVFEKADPSWYEPVFTSVAAKVYRVLR